MQGIGIIVTIDGAFPPPLLFAFIIASCAFVTGPTHYDNDDIYWGLYTWLITQL